MQRHRVGPYLIATGVLLVVGFVTVRMLLGPVHAVRDATGCEIAYADARTRADSISVDFMSFPDSSRPGLHQRCGMLQATRSSPP